MLRYSHVVTRGEQKFRVPRPGPGMNPTGPDPVKLGPGPENWTQLHPVPILGRILSYLVGTQFDRFQLGVPGWSESRSEYPVLRIGFFSYTHIELVIG